MKKLYSLVVLLVAAIGFADAQTFTISGGTAAGTHLYNLVYTWYQAPRTQRLVTHIPAAQLAAGGLTSGMVITSLELERDLNNTLSLPAGANVKLYLENQPATSLDLGAGSFTWSTTNATLVFDGDPSPILGSSPGWKQFAFGTGAGASSTFTYTGGAILVYSDYIHTTAIGGSTSIPMMYASAANGTPAPNGWTTNSTKYSNNSTTTPPATLATSTANHPHLKFNYQPGGPCTAPPVAGNTSISATSNLCYGTNIMLNLTGNSVGSGQTYDWQDSVAGDPTWTTITSGLASPAYSIPVTTTRYYRAIVTCSGQSEASDPVLVTVNPAFPAGVYTIDSSVATGGTNFRNFTDAVAAISCGIAGPITFNLVGSYTKYEEQITLPATIGATSVNTVTFNGNGDTLTFGGSSSGYPTLNLDGADHIIFNNLVVQATGNTNSFAIHLMNGADSNAFNNCSFLASMSATATTSGCVSMSGSLTSYSSAGNNGSYNTFNGCTIKGGYFGVYMAGTSPAANEGNSFINCSVSDFYSYGIYGLQVGSSVISGNTISRPTRATITSAYGVYLSTGSTNNLVEKNRVTNLFAGNTTSTSLAYAIYITGDATAGNENKVYNNLVDNLGANGAHRGIYITGDYVQVYHNTVALNTSSTSGDTYGIHSTATAGVDIKNNNISITRGGSGDKWCLYFTGSGTTSDYNNLYINSLVGSNYIGHAASPVTIDAPDLSAWQGSGAGDVNSVSIDPVFVSPLTGDYTPTGAFDDLGTPVGITTDILNNSRSATAPDMGAYEFTGAPCSLTTAGDAATSTPMVCLLSNTAILTVTGASQGSGQTYSWESGPTLSGPWTSISAPSNTPGLTINPTTTMYYQAVVTCGSTVMTSTPVLVTVNQGLNGNYTINSTLATGGTNFNSFGDAVAALSCGITGPITFDVAPGTGPYAEQVVVSSIPGASATNTITFLGNGDTLTSAGGTSNYATLNLDGADYITFRDLVIMATGASNGFAVHLMNSADSNAFRNCTMIASTTATGTTNAAVSMSNSLTSYSSAGGNGKNNVFDSCTTVGGYFGFVFYGSSATMADNSNNSITNCNVTEYYTYGIYNYYQSNATISRNFISRPTRTSVSTGYGLYLTTGCTNMLVEGNRITNLFGGNSSSTSAAYPIYVAGDGSLGNENKIYNNLIYDLGGNGIHRGLYITGDYALAYHNTIALNSNSTAGDTYGIYATGTAGIDIRNNNVSITRGGSGTKWCLYFTGAGKVSDNNNLFMNSPAGNNYIGHTSVPSASDEASLTSWQQVNSSAWDQNSKTADPMFADLANGDLTPGAFQLDNTGAPVGVTTDFTGATRSATTPDIGAYEISIPICTGTPVAGQASANSNSVCVGASVTLSLANYTSGNGIVIQWEESPAGSGSWTAISGATNATYGATVNAPTDYRATLTCINGGGSDISNELNIYTNPFYLCYCSPLTGVTLQTTAGTNYITNVDIAGTSLNVSTTSAGAGGYIQHDPSIATNTATLTEGAAYTLTATHSSTSTSINAELWIDWDQSGTFDSVEYIPVTTGGLSDVFTFQVPFGVMPGLTGMRVRSVFSTTTNFGANGACTSISVARETEDFVITIDPALQCSGMPNPGFLTATVPNVCSGNTASLDLTGFPPDLGITYQWEESPAGANNFQPITNATATSYVTGPLTSSMDYRVAVTCNNAGGGTAHSNIVTITVTSTLNGTYTIDADAPPSATNFQSFTGAMAALGCGIAGPVIFNVTSPVTKKYVEQIDLTSVPGISATNTITINGNGDTLSFGGSTSNFATLNLNDIDYLTINDLVIEATGSASSFALHMMNGSDNNTFNNCTFLADTTASVTTVGAVVMSNSVTSYSSGGGNGSNNTFNNCTMDGGYFGFVCYGSSTATNTNNNLYNCTIRNYYVYGAYCYYMTNSTISGNEFTRPDRTVVSSGYGVYASTGCSNMLIERNRIHNMFDATSVSTTSVSYGIYLSGDATAGNENKIYNNLIYNLGGSGTHAGLYLTGSDYLKAYHNTIALNTPISTAGTTYGIYSTGTVSVDIKNNNVYITRGGTGTKYCLYYTGAGKTSDFNNLYINAPAGTNNVGYYSAAYATLATWQTANSNAFDQNSKSVDPIFSGLPVDYEPNHPQLNNQATPVGLTNDINGTARSLTTPDIGAYEFTLPSCILPTNLSDSTTTTSATLDWVENGSATQWQIEYGQGNFAQGTGTILNVSTHPYTITGLTHTTEYSYFVRAICGAGDTSIWSPRTVFYTVPSNDTCSAAINVSNGLPMNGTTAGAWQTMPSGSCATSTMYANDVWYYFTTYTAGNVTVTATNTVGDVVLEVLSGTCGNLTALDCQDQPAIGTETVTLNNLAPGTYYIRLYGFLSIENPFVVQVTGTPLAIKLRDISAANVGMRNRINWITATEARGDIFELERSIDGKEFHKLSAINANGEASEYSYWDETPVTGVNYYRIKAVDASGTYSYSKTVSATVKGGAFQVAAYPNPVNDQLTVEVYGQQDKDARIVISDATGKTVKIVEVSSARTVIDMNGLAQGMYLIKYSDATHSQVIKVNKQ